MENIIRNLAVSTIDDNKNTLRLLLEIKVNSCDGINEYDNVVPSALEALEKRQKKIYLSLK